jgi:hypothetical protein
MAENLGLSLSGFEAGPLLCTDHSLFQPYGNLEILQVLAALTNGRRRAW